MHFKQVVKVLSLSIFLASCADPEDPVTDPGLSVHFPVANDLNYLVVSFDALRADALGTYGYPRDTSPNLDAFADEALVFEHAYAASNTTPTSFASTFSGLYPYRVFIGWNLIPTETLAGSMQQNGFHTFGVFNNIQLAEERNFGQGFSDYAVGSWPDEKALELGRQALEDTKGSKFFGWIHFISPHTPYDYREMSAHLAGPQEEGRYAKTTGGTFDIQSDDELARVRDLYDGEIYFGDHIFGQLLSMLEELGLADNTVVIVTSDHGEEFMEHGQVQHNAMYEELIHIPMMIRHPRMADGARTDVRYVGVDLYPTVAAMAGLEAPGGIDGLDLFHPFDARRHRLSVGMTNDKRQEMVNEKDRMKLIVGCAEFTEELYDLSSDPGEQTDLILDRPSLAGSLYDAMEKITVSNPCGLLKNANRGKAPEDHLSPEQIEQLRSLGYIQ
jgi:arylsulfatase